MNNFSNQLFVNLHFESSSIGWAPRVIVALRAGSIESKADLVVMQLSHH